MKMKEINRKGFTLVELLAVIVVISLVLGLSTYGIISSSKKSKDMAMEINDKSIFEAARIRSSEENTWQAFDNDEFQYYCTSIQQLKNAGLLKKNIVASDGKGPIIIVKRNASTYNISETRFLDLDNENDKYLNKQLCKIEYFTIHYDYNVDGENGLVPDDQIEEVCNTSDCKISLSLMKPKRNGYNFVGWSLPDRSVVYKAGDRFYSGNAGETITLYAKWKVKSFKIVYDANSSSYSGSMDNTICEYNRNCIVSDNSFVRDGYNFVGWNTKASGNGTNYNAGADVSDLLSSGTLKLYAKWKSAKKVTILFNVNGGTISQNTSNGKNNYSWIVDDNGIISRSVNNGKYTNHFFTVNYGEEKHLPEYNNSEYINISAPRGMTVQSGSEWKCTDCAIENSIYSQSKIYSFEDFCGNNSSDCIVHLAVNFENNNLLSPIFLPSDGIESGKWHNKDYTLRLTSNNTSNVSFKYKVDNDLSTLKYDDNNPIIPSEGISTYYSWTESDAGISGTSLYVSMLDKTAPDKPTIDNPTNENWTNQNFSLTYHSYDAGSGIKEYQYTYNENPSDSDWITYTNSAFDDFTSTPFKKERNQLVYIRVCDNAGNCSEASSTYIRLDKTAPSVPVINNPNSGKWMNVGYNITISSTDNLSGIARYEYLHGDSTPWNEENITVHPNSAANSITRKWSAERNSSLFERACDYAGNCSEPSKSFVKIDKTPPSKPVIDNPNSGKWMNEGYYITLSSSDNLSGIARYEYVYGDSTPWNEENIHVHPDSAANSITRKWSSERNTSLYERACDYAGNCSEISKTFVKIDKTDPSLSAVLMNGNNIVDSKYYRFSYDSTLQWFYGFTPKIRWTISDSLSGIDSTSAYYYYNNSGGQTLDESHQDYTTNKFASNLTNSGSENAYYFVLGGINGGYRKFKLKVCDVAGNCSNSPIFFKYYANGVNKKYVNVNTSSYLNCRTTPKSFGNPISKKFYCGNEVNVLLSYASGWYYNVNNNCYFSGNYLVSSSPNCSSGGGSGGGSSGGGTSEDSGNDNSNCTSCVRTNDCYAFTYGTSDVSCVNNICAVIDRSTGRKIGCV